MKEEEIRPQAVFDEYLRLAKIDIENYFKDVFYKLYLRVLDMEVTKYDMHPCLIKRRILFVLCRGRISER